MNKILLIAYDNDSHISFFPMSLGYIAAVLKEEGHYVSIWQQDVHHYPDKELTKFLDSRQYDTVGISVSGGYYQYNRLKGLSQAINSSSKKPLFVVGGHMCTPEPQYFIDKFGIDIVVMGEGERTICSLLERQLKDVKGIAYNGGVNERQPLIRNLDDIPFPAYSLFPMGYYRLRPYPGSERHKFTMTIISSRGCTFQCNFCYRMDKGLRLRSCDSIIEEILMLYKDYGITYILFDDELTMSSKKRIIELSEAFIEAGLPKMGIQWGCNGRLNYVTREIVRLMKRAGCTFINYGIEAFDNKVLKNMGKAITIGIIKRAIKDTLMEGVSPGLNMLWGNIGDDLNTLEKAVYFLLTYDDFVQCRTIRPVTPYPGCPLYYNAIDMGLLDSDNPVEDFYERKHINSDLLTCNFTRLSDEEYYKALHRANMVLLKNYYDHNWKRVEEQTRKLYFEKDTSFRGFKLV